MKRTHTLIAALVAAVTLSGVAMAQAGKGCDGMGPMGRQASMKFDPAQRAGQHLQTLKSELKVTAEQEALWQAFAEKVKGEAGKGMHAQRALAPVEKLPAPERMAQMGALMAERLAAMKGVHESFNRLYAALTPEQKAVADRHMARLGQGKMGGPGRGMPPAQG